MTDEEKYLSQVILQKGDHSGWDVVCDGQFGSTGKGLLAAVLADHTKYQIYMTNNGPNAGHTAYFHNEKIVAKQLPVGAIFHRMKYDETPQIYLNAGAIIHPETLADECAKYLIDPNHVFIHPAATIIKPHHVEQEMNTSSGAAKIASTGKGVGAALAAKLSRLENNIARNEPALQGFRIDAIDVNGLGYVGGTGLYEIPQGFSLGINSPFYPHVTSRECTIQQGMADARMHYTSLRSTYMAIRTYPIRVGNTGHGYSGDCYGDQQEVSWEAIDQIPETTTVTGRVRRVFTFSDRQFISAMGVNRPDVVFVNFMNYFKSPAEVGLFKRRLMKNCMDLRHIPAFLFGWGPHNKDVMPW